MCTEPHFLVQHQCGLYKAAWLHKLHQNVWQRVSGLCPDSRPLGSPQEGREERGIDGGREVTNQDLWQIAATGWSIDGAFVRIYVELLSTFHTTSLSTLQVSQSICGLLWPMNSSFSAYEVSTNFLKALLHRGQWTAVQPLKLVIFPLNPVCSVISQTFWDV